MKASDLSTLTIAANDQVSPVVTNLISKGSIPRSSAVDDTTVVFHTSSACCELIDYSHAGTSALLFAKAKS